jgi:hypothetical protein
MFVFSSDALLNIFFFYYNYILSKKLFFCLFVCLLLFFFGQCEHPSVEATIISKNQEVTMLEFPCLLGWTRLLH